ncbi:MAG: hypothetical protein ACM3QS_07425 [Bacteroidota bacterium]
MVTSSDLIHLTYSPDLTEGGIAYAVRSLPYTYNRMGGTPFERLRRIVAGVAVELALRRYLFAQGIRFDVKGATPFTDPDRYDVSLGGRRCDLKSFLVSRRSQISEMRRDPAIVLKAPALVPLDQHASNGHAEHDLYVFAFLQGLVTASHSALEQALRAGQPAYLLHTLPEDWVRPRIWRPLRPLALKSEAEETLRVELAGQDQEREFLTRRVDLPPRTRVEIADPFFSVSSIHVDRLPRARLGLHSGGLEKTYVAEPGDWGNIWVYGLEILLAGYMSRREFAEKASLIQPGSRVFQYQRTRARNLAVPVADLRPLGSLVEQVRAWEAARAAGSGT